MITRITSYLYLIQYKCHGYDINTNIDKVKYNVDYLNECEMQMIYKPNIFENRIMIPYTVETKRQHKTD